MNNQYEWDIPPKKHKGKIIKFVILIIIAITLIILSLTGKTTYKPIPQVPNPALEYPQYEAIIDINNLPGNDIKHLAKDELIDYLDVRGFSRLKDKNIVDLRRMYLAFMYDRFFYDMHSLTDLPVSVIYAFFIIEATNNGIESKLMRKAFNPGGIKYRGKGKKVKAMDDCYVKGKRVPCSFQAYTSYDAMVQGWAGVLNLPRYKKCKRFVFKEFNRGMTAKEIVNATCKCFYKSGYHTSNLWQVRSNLSTEYWTMRAGFPKDEF